MPVNYSVLNKRNIIIACIIWKTISILSIMCVVDSLVPPKKTLLLSRESYFTSLTNWDAAHYLNIAENGYNTDNLGFYPLFPYLIRLTSTITGNNVFSGIILTTIFSFLFLYYYHKLATDLFGISTANLSVMLIIAYPSSVFLTAIYTESLFLFILIFYIWYFNIKKSYWCIIPGILLVLTRGQGFFVGLAMLIILIYELPEILRRRNINRFMFIVFSGLSFAVGGSLLILFYWWLSGDPFAFIHAQQFSSVNFSVDNIYNPMYFIKYMISPVSEFHNVVNGLIDRICVWFILVIGIYVLLVKKHEISIIFFTLAYFPAAMGSGGAYIRYSLLPFAIAAIIISNRMETDKSVLLLKQKWFCLLYFTSSIFIQTLFSLAYASGRWVG